MVGEAAIQKKLYDAATIGDVETFQEVIQQVPHFLDVVSFPCLRNVLHIAIRKGKESLVAEVLRIDPELARDVDSKKSSSLHIAAAQGNVEIAKILLSIAPEMCWWLDDQGMNPVHIAAMKGHVDILQELLQQDLYPAMERVQRGQTVLHLCVKHRQLETLKVLMKYLSDLVCAKDDDGETLLHLAVRSNQDKMIKYLVKDNTTEVLTTNSTGKTALAILNESPSLKTTDSKIRRMLVCLENQSILQSLPKMTDTTMVVVVLIATMAFQATVSPPGGVWQDDTSSHRAGQAVMSTTQPIIYKHFVRANNTAFVSSLITIFLVTTNGPSCHFFFLTIATYGMWVSMASIAVGYGASSIMINRSNPTETKFEHVVAIVVFVFLGIFVLLFIYLGILAMYSAWERKHRQRKDLKTTPIKFVRDCHQILPRFNQSPEDTIRRWKNIGRTLRNWILPSDTPV